MTDIQFMGLMGLGCAIIAAVPPSIIAWSARSKVVDTSAKADSIIEKAEQTDAKANTIIEKTAEIHTATNSHLSSVTSELAAANAEIKGFTEQMRTSGAEIKALQKLVNTLVEREAGVEQAVKETNGILREKTDSGPLPVVDDQLASKIDGIVSPKLDKIQDTVDEKK